MTPWTIHEGDALTVLKTLPDASVQTCVTSPPYWGLRDYGHDGQIGLEKTPDEYVAALVEVFREVRRVLRDDGVMRWADEGKLAVTRRGYAGRDPWAVTEAAVVAFVVEHPHDFELRRVNQQWFMDLVTDAALMGAALGIRGAERAA